MLTQKTYTDLLKDLATRHVEIQHTEKNQRFLKLIVAADPIQKIANLSTFYQKGKATLPGNDFFVVQLSYDTLHQDTGADEVKAHRRGGFMVMHKARDTQESRDQVLSDTERIGYELMAAVCEFFRGMAGRRAGRTLDRSSIAVEAVGPLGDYFCGTRFEFDFTESATQSLTYDATRFAS
jgi:hypothetical protein